MSTSADYFPTHHTILSADALLETVRRAYPLETPIKCSLHRANPNDTYILQTIATRFILRVYGAQSRTQAEIQYELELLQHLAQQGISVAGPIARNDGTLLTPFSAPEGIRYGVLFSYAPGMLPEPAPLGTVEQSQHFGAALAALHSAADTFRSTFSRPAQDASYLLDQPLIELQPLLSHRPADWDYLTRVAAHVRTQLTRFVEHDHDWGVIHGDPFSGNATITSDQRVTWYDFDLCGPGWRIMDIAAAYGHAMRQPHPTHEDEQRWHSFLAGYETQRPISAADRSAIPLALAAVGIYFLALNATKGPILGFEQWGSDQHITRSLDWLRRWIGREL